MNRALPPGDRGHQNPALGWAPGHRGAVPGAQGLVLGIAAVAGGAAAAPAFTVIKHGGFARLWRETPCAMAVGKCS